jgi:hypothetical protein
VAFGDAARRRRWPEPVLGQKGMLLLGEGFDGDVLPGGWNTHSGRLRVTDGVLRASQEKGERLCLFSCARPMKDAAIRIDFKFDGARGINVGLSPSPGETRKRGHLFSVMITPPMWNITRHQDRLDPDSKVAVLASAAETFEQGRWYTLLVETRGDYVVAQVEGKKPLRVVGEGFRVKKPGIEFRVAGRGGGDACFDNLRVWELE